MKKGIVTTLFVMLVVIGCSNPGTPAAAEYGVTYHGNGGQGELPLDESSYQSGEEFVLAESESLSMVGHHFTGWATEAQGQELFQPGDSYTMGAQAITFYAQWGVSSYELQFDANGGSGTMQAMSLDYEETESLPHCSFSRDGYQFTGWTSDREGNVTPLADQADYTMGSQNETLYAQWVPVYGIGTELDVSQGTVTLVHLGTTLGEQVTVVPDEEYSVAVEESYASYQWYINGMPGPMEQSFADFFPRPGITELAVVVTDDQGNIYSASVQFIAQNSISQ